MIAKNVSAVFRKQLKDTFKNKSIMIEFLIFPIVAMVMETSINIVDMPDRYFVKMFATMFIGMAPFSSMAAIISEEKEKNTLRVLAMSNVKPHEYLFGIGSCIWLISMAGGCVFGLIGRYSGVQLLLFLVIMGVGTLTSMLMGSVIGIWCKNQMTATSISVPVMMVFAFLPMLSMFNEVISKISTFTYSQQISNLLNQIGTGNVNSENIIVVTFNMLVAVMLFVLAYRKSGLA